MIKPATIQLSISLNMLRQNIRTIGISNLIELHNMIEEILLEYEDKKLSSNSSIRKEIEFAKKEYKLGLHKPLNKLFKKH